MAFSEAFNIVLLLVVVIQGFLISKQVNITEVNRLISTLAPTVKATETQADDIALNVVKVLVDMLSPTAHPGVPSSPMATNDGELSEKRGV